LSRNGFGQGKDVGWAPPTNLLSQMPCL